MAAVGFARAGARAQLPTNFTAVTTHIYVSNSIAPGYVFLASSGKKGDKGPYFLQIMNNAGLPYAYKLAGYLQPGDNYYPRDFKVLANGLLLNAQYTGWFSYISGGTVIDQLLDENLNLVETLQMGNGYQAEGHDFELLPNGHVLMMGYYTTLADIRSAAPAAYPRTEVSGAVIQELDGNRKVVWQWRTWDHFNWTDFSDWGSGSTGSLIAGWHVDAVRLDPMDQNLLVATTGEAMKINRQTGRVMWRLGGARNQFTFAGVAPQEALLQLAGHDFHRLPNGNVLLFNNGAADGSRTSQVHEYQLDEVNKVATHVWQYVPATTVPTCAMGNAQRLPNGNTFIGWGASNGGNHPACTEVTSSGQVVFDLSFTNALMDSYRAFRFVYPPDAQVIGAAAFDLTGRNTYSFANTGVTIDVATEIGGDSYGSATLTREPYAPLYPFFAAKAPSLLPVRINMAPLAGAQILTGEISFDATSFGLADATNTTVYYRPTPNQAGVFAPVASSYNWVTHQLVAEMTQNGFGEYAFGVADVADVVIPPSLIAPQSLPSAAFATRTPPVVAPGERYTVNQSLPISLSWTPNGFATNYYLQVSRNADFSAPDVDQSTLTEARYAFSNALSNTTYFWRVNAANTAGVSEWSTNAFATVPPMIQVTAPNGGENWRRGMPYFIQWDANLQENVAIDLYQAGALVKTIATNTPSTVSYPWLVGLDLPPARDYSIRIRSVTNASVSGLSDLPFSLVDAPVINANSLLRLPDGSARFTLTAPGATQVTVLGSTNLSVWQALEVIPLTGDKGVFTDNAAPGSAMRFYCLRVP